MEQTQHGPMKLPKGQTLRDRHSMVQLNAPTEKLYRTDTVLSNETPKRTNSTGQTQCCPLKLSRGQTLWDRQSVVQSNAPEGETILDRHSVVH